MIQIDIILTQFIFIKKQILMTIIIFTYPMYQFGISKLVENLILSFLTKNEKQRVVNDLAMLRWNITYIRYRHAILKKDSIDRIVTKRKILFDQLKNNKGNIKQIRKLRRRIRRNNSYQTQIQYYATLSLVECKGEVNRVTARLFQVHIYHNPTFCYGSS